VLAGALCLNRRARHRTKGTEYAAIAWLCLQLFAATGAFIEKLTGICRHRLGFRDGAMRTYESIEKASVQLWVLDEVGQGMILVRACGTFPRDTLNCS
jgi:hypothetical protein